ncbi:hypothetical protein ONE63_001347 [Megalurothrips usitatus]|uniref:HotDog ACOT-type domain-containing protein n=1 Tax=Megalurothrips usitatus TaxID=439358 RepID=A0AAV7XFX6_9NEOP|nr:hypothetical protein ONE63_001347 [Megalurothrips usitatus]
MASHVFMKLCRLTRPSQLPTLSGRYALVPARKHGYLRSQESGESGEPVQTIAEMREKLHKIMGIQKGYTPLKVDRTHLLEMLPGSQKELPVRKMNDSFDRALIPLSSDLEMREKYSTLHGYVRLGRLMEDMDIFAVWLAFKHIENPKQKPDLPTPYNIVTVLVDQIDFTSVIPSPDADIRLSGHVSWVSKSTMETVVWLEQFQHGAWRKITRAIFLMAARNSTNTHSAPINSLTASTEEEAKILDGGLARKLRRSEVQKQNLLRVTPDVNEQHIIHQLFLDTVEPQDLTYEQRILPPNGRWMSDTLVTNIINSHPEDRNMHNTVFGGFLMRQAVELSSTCCFAHSYFKPRLVCMSDIVFHRPVEVGALLKMHARVVYAEMDHAQVMTYAEVTDPYGGTKKTTNVFHFTYQVPQIVRKVYPATYHEAMAYLDGRRHFQHAMGLTGNNTTRGLP